MVPQEILLTESARADFTSPLPPVPVLRISEKESLRLSSYTSAPGIFGVFTLPSIQNSYQPENGWALYLDGISDPGNLGTILRTAHWFGIQNIILAPQTTDPFAPKVVQSSMGSLAAMRFYEIPASDIRGTCYVLHLQGEWKSETPQEPGILVLGSESHGVQQNWDSHAAVQKIKIPSFSAGEAPESLNVAASLAVLMGAWKL